MALRKESEQCRDGPCLCECKQNQKDKFEHEATSVVSVMSEKKAQLPLYVYFQISL